MNIKNTDEIKERLRAIINKSARTLTDEEKDYLFSLGERLGIEKQGKFGCQKCWHDLAIRCWQDIAAREEKDAPKSAETDRKYVLKKGVDLLFGQIRVNEMTLTDELAEYIIGKGFEKKWFEKCE